jgi:hypothetical protein
MYKWVNDGEMVSVAVEYGELKAHIMVSQRYETCCM